MVKVARMVTVEAELVLLGFFFDLMERLVRQDVKAALLSIQLLVLVDVFTPLGRETVGVVGKYANCLLLVEKFPADVLV